MNVSSRWWFTALLALGSYGCSDPVPPAAQGAFIASISPVSPAVSGKMCPVTASTYDVPEIRATKPAEQLSDSTYIHKAIDGENAELSCTVKAGGGGFSFSGRIIANKQSFQISDGTLGADGKGTARILVKSRELSSSLTSSGANCTVVASSFKAGSMWAHFTCAAVENPPGELCKAEGTFVIENCVQ